MHQFLRWSSPATFVNITCSESSLKVVVSHGPETYENFRASFYYYVLTSYCSSTHEIVEITCAKICVQVTSSCDTGLRKRL